MCGPLRFLVMIQTGFSRVGENQILGLFLLCSGEQCDFDQFFFIDFLKIIEQYGPNIIIIDMNQDYQERAKFIQEEQRKNLIQSALLRLKKKNQNYLQELEANAKWRKIYNGLLFNNCQSELPKLINLQLCEANDKEDYGFFNPFQKIPISLCYNKINQKELFQKHAIFNLILLYDSRIKREMNWNNIQQTAKSTMRALNISGICNKTDKNCFQAEIQKRVLQKERFKGKPLDFDKVYEDALADMAPISQVGYS